MLYVIFSIVYAIYILSLTYSCLLARISFAFIKVKV
jgi:hypothetical protein